MNSEVGGWPNGQTLDDLVEYAMAQGAEGHDVDEVQLCECAECAGHVFGVEGDLEEPAAKRICRGCYGEHFIADSGQYWDDTGAGIMVCECEGHGDEENLNVAVAYSL